MERDRHSPGGSHRLIGHRFGGLLALALACGGCARSDNPYKIPPAIAGQVELTASLADVAGTPAGTQTFTNLNGVRAWLMEAGQPVDSTLTERGVYHFFVRRNHTYRARFGIPPAFVDSSNEITALRDIGYYPNTLRLGRRGNITSRPNPFSIQVWLTFPVASDTHVEIRVHDLSARPVRVLASRTFVAGFHELLWDGRDDANIEVANGPYWVIFQTATEVRAELVVKQP